MKKKRFIYLCMLLFILCVCIFSGWIYNKKSYAVFDKNISSLKKDSNPGEAVMVNSPNNAKDFFISAKNDRDMARAKAVDGYNKMIQNPDISQDSRKKCEDALQRINEDIIKETDAQSIIRSKGIDDVIVFINQDSVTVTVGTPKLTSPEISRIKDVISEFVSTKNIKIVEVG